MGAATSLMTVEEGEGSRPDRVRVAGVGERGAAMDVISWDAREFSWTRGGAEVER